MSDPERLRERLLSELDSGRHTHKSLRESLADEYGYSNEEITHAISTLHDEGVISHEQGFFETVDTRE